MNLLRTWEEVRTADVIVVGAGIAGLATALHLEGRRVIVISKTRLGQGGSTSLAQGGVAAAVGSDDSTALHAADTIAVGGGINSVTAVDILTSEGPRRVLELVPLGVRFDRNTQGEIQLGREAAHSRRRILHAADATGAELLRGLSEAVRVASHVTVAENTFAADLLVARGRAVGVLGLQPDGRQILYIAPAVVLATGGIGQLYQYTTNPVEATADGLAMAARAGATLQDLEFVQFHPTALQSGVDPMPLLSEAIRGEGATLIDETGHRFMLDIHPDAELAPRDVVARAIWFHQAQGHQTFLDARHLKDSFIERFPTAWKACQREGLDPRIQPVPVSPACHFHMGGVATDEDGRTSIGGLWACGEVAATGVHGANRLASNSLLEGLVFGARVAEDILGSPLAPVRGRDVFTAVAALRTSAGAKRRYGREPQREAEIRKVMWDKAGLVREEGGLRQAQAWLKGLERAAETEVGETRNLLLAAQLLVEAALSRRESRGAHYRSDYPQTQSLGPARTAERVAG